MRPEVVDGVFVPRVEADQLPEVDISYNAALQLAYHVWTSPIEVSGLGSLKEVPGSDGKLHLLVDNIWLTEQQRSGVHARLSAMGIVKLMHQLQGKVNGSELRFWWHSHHTMGMFWSWVDRPTQAHFSRKFPLLSMVLDTHILEVPGIKRNSEFNADLLHAQAMQLNRALACYSMNGGLHLDGLKINILRPGADAIQKAMEEHLDICTLEGLEVPDEVDDEKREVAEETLARAGAEVEA